MKPLHPWCCVCAEFDGIPPEVHAEVCRESPAPAVQEPTDA